MPRMKLPTPRNSPKSRDIYGNVKVEKTGKIYSMETNTLHINGIIDDWFGVSADEVSEALAEMDDSQPLKVVINSDGGLVFEAIAIHNMIADWPSAVTTHVTSMAASAATTIFMVGDERTMSDNAEFMIHHPWTIAMGNAPEFRGVADHLDRTAEKIIDMYDRKSNLERDEINALMHGPEGTDGTYMTATETVEAGFATGIIDTSRGGTEDAESNFAPRRILAKIALA